MTATALHDIDVAAPRRRWAAKRLKYLTSHIGSGKTPRGGAEVYQDSGVLLIRSQNVHSGGLRLDDVAFIDDAADEELRASRVRLADVLLNITGASLGRCAWVRNDIGRANVNQHVCIIRTIHRLLNPAFLHYALISDLIQSAIFASENGISREGLNFRQVGNLHLPLPPLDEQRAIAAFLDRETARIDELIAKKKLVLQRLDDKWISHLANAVTRGLIDSTHLRPTGVPWCDSLPISWGFLPLRRFINHIEQGWSPQADQRITDDDEWAVLKVGAVLRGRFRPEEHKALPPDLEPETRYLIQEGDLLLTRGNTPELVADVCVVPATRPRLLLSDLHYRITFNESKLSKHFACYWLLSCPGRSQIEADARGTSNSMVKVSQQHIRAWLVPVPSVAEQATICNALDAEKQKLDAVAVRINQAIERLKEYRSTLITAAVTGQIDVRKEAP